MDGKAVLTALTGMVWIRSLVVGLVGVCGLMACGGRVVSDATSEDPDSYRFPPLDASGATSEPSDPGDGGLRCSAQGYTWDGRKLENGAKCTYAIPDTIPDGRPVNLFSMVVVAETFCDDLCPGDYADGLRKHGLEDCGDDYGWYYNAPLVQGAPKPDLVMCPRSCTIGQEIGYVRISVEWACTGP